MFSFSLRTSPISTPAPTSSSPVPTDPNQVNGSAQAAIVDTATTTETPPTTSTTTAIVAVPKPVAQPPPPVPGVPVAVERTATSLTIAWPASADDPCPDYDFLLEPVNPDVEYEIRYARAGYRYDMWNSVGLVTPRRWLRVDGLLPDHGYVFQVRARYRVQPAVNADLSQIPESIDLSISRSGKLPANSNKWSNTGGSSKALKTLLIDEQERIENLGRLRVFILEGSRGLPQYPEDPEIPDTVGAKAARTMEGLVTAVSQSGLGGAYFSLVKNAWKIHKTGIASLIFHPDLQQTVYVLLAFLNTVAGDIGLSSKDVVVGSYFALWEAKRERLLHPLAEFEEHSEGAPGVIASQAPSVLINELMFYFPLAGMAYRKSPAQIQWVLDKFTAADPKMVDDADVQSGGSIGSKQGGFRLVSAKTSSTKFRPAFFLAAHEDLKTAIFVVRGTSELEDLVTDGLCDVQAAPFKFGEDSHTFHVHAGMLQAARWLVRGDDRRRHFEEDERQEQEQKQQPAKDSKSTAEEVADEDQREGAGVGAAVAKLWAAGYRRVVFCGHSLGGGVATLAALLIADKFRELEIKVYGYGTPAVVDERLAEACKGKHAPEGNLVQGLGRRVTVKNIIRHDDIVPRLSLLTARDFAIHLKDTRSKWGPLLNQDIASFTQRIKTVWAPVQRAHSVNRAKAMRVGAKPASSSSANNSTEAPAEKIEEMITNGEVKDATEVEMLPAAEGPLMVAQEVTTTATSNPEAAVVGDSMTMTTVMTTSTTTTTVVVEEEKASEQTRRPSKTQEVAERLKRSFTNPLVVPGLIVHTYKLHGTHLASLVDYNFPGLRQISAFQNCIDDHRFDEIMIGVRSVLFATAAREAGRLPPHWESLSDHMNDSEEWQVRCRVCTYPVSWHQTSNSEAFEIRATHHCHSCGKIVCSKCSEGRVALPHIGIITPVRVCDLCKYHLFEPKTGQKNMFDIDEY